MTSSDPLLSEVEYTEVTSPLPPPSVLRIASYNIERGLRLDSIVAQWKQEPAKLNDVILISEADRGMARSGNRHVAQEFAAAIGFSCGYAVEFLELTQGSLGERRLSAKNEAGHIGNAILSRYPMTNLEVIRLPCFLDYASRFAARIGSRMAVAADLDIGGRTHTVISVHLENVSSPQQRLHQMEALLSRIRYRDRGQPLVIGGDMNTTGLDVNKLLLSVFRHPGLVVKHPSIEKLERTEPLFSLLRRKGYNYRRCNIDGHTLQRWGYKAHLDWFFVKNVEPRDIQNPSIYGAFKNRRRFSDHLPIAIALTMNNQCA